jgi:hypothetical protein
VITHAAPLPAPHGRAKPARQAQPKPAPRRHRAPPPVPLHPLATQLSRRPPYGLVGVAALLAVLGAGSLAVTVAQLRAGAA